jgi:hypothetical protein
MMLQGNITFLQQVNTSKKKRKRGAAAQDFGTFVSMG